MGGKSGKPTIGYWYDMDVLATACLKVDAVTEFKFADKQAWTGSVTETGTISIYRDDLFGGAEREGGVFGQIDIMMGEPDQPLNEFLGTSMRSSGITDPVPAYRNSVNFFFRGVKPIDPEFKTSGIFIQAPETPPLAKTFNSFALKPMPQPKAFRWSAMNPYFKPFKVKVNRYTKDWLPAIAKIATKAGVLIDISAHESQPPKKIFEKIQAYTSYIYDAVGASWREVHAYPYQVDATSANFYHRWSPANGSDTWAEQATYRRVEEDYDKPLIEWDRTRTANYRVLIHYHQGLSDHPTLYRNWQEYAPSFGPHTNDHMYPPTTSGWQKRLGVTITFGYGGFWLGGTFWTGGTHEGTTYTDQAAYGAAIGVNGSELDGHYYVMNNDFIFKLSSSLAIVLVRPIADSGGGTVFKLWTDGGKLYRFQAGGGESTRMFIYDCATLTLIKTVDFGGMPTVGDFQCTVSGSILSRAWYSIYQSGTGEAGGGMHFEKWRISNFPFDEDTLVDTNPAHIIRECITDSSWGLGLPTSDVDDGTFSAVAQTLYDEAFGLSFKWSTQMSIEDFIMIVLRHINAVVYQDRETGKIKLKLIRADYDAGDIIELNPTNSTLMSFGRATNGEAVNTINLTHSKSSGGVDVITTHDIGSIELIGSISQDVEMLGIRSPHLAARVAQRELESRVKPIAKISIVTNRIGSTLHEGSVFRLSWPDSGIASMVCRVVDINCGTLTNNQIEINAVQDVFGLPTTSYVTPQVSGWANPVQQVQPSPYVYVTETPYYNIVRGMSAADFAELDETDCLIDVFAEAPSGDAIDYMLWTASGDSELVKRNTGSHAAVSVLTQSIGKLEDGNIEIENIEAFVEAIESDDAYVIINGECAKITDYDVALSSLTVDRGVFDTVPIPHAAGSKVILADLSAANDEVSYLNGEVVSVKVQTRNTKGPLNVNFAQSTSYTIDQRQRRPYPPGRLRINGDVYPTTIGLADGLSLNWAHRNRLTQTAGVIPQHYSDITPEIGATYNIRVFGDSNVLMRSVSGITDNNYEYTPSMELLDLGIPEVVDTSWDKTPIVLNMDGVDNSTVILNTADSYCEFLGGSKLSTAEFKFGTASLLLTSAGDYVRQWDGNFNIGSSDFTIECWVRPTSVSIDRVVFDMRPTGANGAYPSLLVNSTSVYYLTNSATRITSGVLPLNAWTHIAVVRSSGLTKMYINGVKVGATYTDSNVYLGSTITIGVSSQNTTQGNWLGNIDEFIVSRSAKYTSDFTLPTAGLVKFVTGANHSQMSLLLTFDSYDGLSSHSDCSNTNQPLTVMKPVSTTKSMFGGSSLYVPQSDLAFTGDVVSFNTLYDTARPGDMTIAGWINVDSPLSYDDVVNSIAGAGIASNLYTGGVLTGWQLSVNSNGKLQFTIFEFNVIKMAIVGVTTITTAAWHHVAACRSGTTWTLFLDGAVEGSGVDFQGELANTDVTIGFSYGTSSNLGGYIDEFSISNVARWSSAFTVPTVSEYYINPDWQHVASYLNFEGVNNATRLKSLTGLTRTLPTVGAAKISTSQSKFGGSSCYFDGSSWLAAPAASGFVFTGDLTIETWVRINGNSPVDGAGQRSACIFAMCTGNTSSSMMFYIKGDATVTGTALALWTGSVNLEVALGVTLSKDEWHHVAMSRSGSTIRFFVNGELIGDVAHGAALGNYSHSITVGGRLVSGAYTNRLNGYMDSIRVTKGVARYIANFDLPDSGFTEDIINTTNLNSMLTVELESERGGLASWQKHRHTVTRT